MTQRKIINPDVRLVRVAKPKRKSKNKARIVRPETPEKALEDFRSNLAFCRTDDERSVMELIIADLERRVAPEVRVEPLFKQTGIVQRVKRPRSGYIGVTLTRRLKSTGEMACRVSFNGKTQWFRDPVAAAMHYDRLAVEAWGKDAILNFPEPVEGGHQAPFRIGRTINLVSRKQIAMRKANGQFAKRENVEK